VVDALNKRVFQMYVATISIYKSDLKDLILKAAKSNQHYLETKEKLQQSNFQQKIKYYELREDGILMYRGRVYVLKYHEMRNMVLREMHNVSCVGNQGYQKTIAAIKRQYVCPGMKKEMANYIARCLECQKVKV
jgi:hypothetical protein